MNSMNECLNEWVEAPEESIQPQFYLQEAGVNNYFSQVNAKRLDNICHDNAVDAFRTTEDTVALLIEKNAESYILVSF